jgi:hypothetical protein
VVPDLRALGFTDQEIGNALGYGEKSARKAVGRKYGPRDAQSHQGASAEVTPDPSPLDPGQPGSGDPVSTDVDKRVMA